MGWRGWWSSQIWYHLNPGGALGLVKVNSYSWPRPRVRQYLSILSVKCLTYLPKIRNNPDGVTADDDDHNVDSDTRELHLALTQSFLQNKIGTGAIKTKNVPNCGKRP